MKHFRARHFAVAASFACLFTAIAQAPLPDEYNFTDDNHIRYEVVDGTAGTVKVTSLSSCEGEVTVPHIVKHFTFGEEYTLQVTGIGEGALETFSSSTTELALTLSEGIEFIEDNALCIAGRGKVYLTSISLPSSLKSIGMTPFYDQERLKELSIPASVTTFGLTALDGLKLETLYFNSKKVTSTNPLFASYQSLGKLVIGPDVQVLDNKLFNNLKNIGSIEIADSETPLFLSTKSFSSADPETFSCLRQLEFTDGDSDSQSGLLSGCANLKKIILGGKMTSVPASFAFRNGSVKSLELSGDIESIGNQAFWGASGLTSLTLNTPKLKSVGSQAFYNAGLTGELILPEGVEVIDEMAFQRCQFSKIVIPGSVKRIGVFAFDTNWTLDEVIFEDSEETLTADCNQYSQWSIFSYGVKKAYIGRNIDFLRDKLWYTDGSIQLTDLVIGDYVTDVTKLALPENKKIENLTVGARITRMPAMPECTALRTIKMNGAVPPEAGGFAQEVFDNGTLIVPEGSERAYSKADVWKLFFNLDIPFLDIESGKIRYTAGEGSEKTLLAVQFGSAPLMDNMVWAYSYDGTMPKPADIVAAIAEADPRFSAEFSGDAVTAASFDIDGNGIINESDATASDNDTASWQLGEAVAADGKTPVITLTYASSSATKSENATAEYPYFFYVPEPDATGVFMPFEMNIALSDEAPVIPVVYNTGGNEPGNLYWRLSTAPDSYTSDKSVLSTVSSAGNTACGTGKFTGKTGTTYVAARMLIGGSFQEADYCTVNITAPVRPITAISFADAAVTSPLNKNVVNELTYEPADATYTAMTIATSDSKIATVNSSTLTAKATKTAGTAQITVSYVYDPLVNDSYYVATRLMNPVTDVTFEGARGDVINVPVKQLSGLRPIVTPADADIPDVTITLSDNGSSREDYTCTIYKVNYWDADGVRSQFFELSGHRPTGDTPAKVHVESADGTFSKDFTVNVIEADRTPLEGGYTDGTILLNEEWFGHTNGGFNYLTPDNEIIYQAYEKENPGMSLGCTSCHATIWNGKFIAMSKQASDGGDVLPGGGRLVIADAATMKRMGSLDDLVFGEEEGDGRAVAGATPDKIYAGSNNGIFIVDISDAADPKITGRIGGSESDSDLYSGQIGDMVSTRRYVFAVKQGSPLAAIDVDTDEIVAQFGANVQGVTQSADGTVWLTMPDTDESGAQCNRFIGIDPETLEQTYDVLMPARVGTVACGWGAWRPTQFTASRTRNELWFSNAGASVSGGGEGSYYCYEIGSDPETVREVFSLKEFNTTTDGLKQQTYGQLAIDDRNDQLYVMTTVRGAASGQYRDHWFHRIDRNSGDIVGTIHLNPYYWFQAMSVFPDKYEPEIDFSDVMMKFNDLEELKASEALEYDLAEYAGDADNIAANIRFSAECIPAPGARAASSSVAEVGVEGSTLRIKPLGFGAESLTVTAESNGRRVSKTVNLAITRTTSAGDAVAAGASVYCDGQRLVIDGCDGCAFSIFDLAGRLLTAFDVDSDHYVLDMSGHTGAYIVSGNNGLTAKIVIK